MAGRRLEARFQWQHAKDNHPESDDLARIESKLKDGLPDVVDAKPVDDSAVAKPTQPADDKATKPTNG